jgi:hypothetical protein
VATRDIRTSEAIHQACDVCGRTLLRGEKPEVFLDGGARKSVCELCTSRALHEGWVREGAAPAFNGREASGDRRRSLLGRLRPRRDGGVPDAGASSGGGDGGGGGGELEFDAPAPAPGRTPDPWPDPAAALARGRRAMREPRHVRAVPTSGEQRVVQAVDLFNGSEHRRTIAGVARSLGAPTVSVLPSDVRTSVVNVTVSWELCWYRYEVDLSDELPSVRVASQGYELDELPPEERVPNAVADEHGGLVLA